MGSSGRSPTQGKEAYQRLERRLILMFEKNLGDSTGTVTLDGAIYGYSNDGGSQAGFESES